MDRFPERPFSNLTEEMLVFHYLGAARSLLAAPYREAASLDQPLALAIGGSLSFETIVHVDRAAPTGEPLVTMLMEPATGLGRRRPVPAERLEPFDRLTVSLSEGPAFVRDALARAHDLAAVPVPWRFVSGARSAVADMQLAILTTILAALSELAAGADRATASLALGGHRVDALLGPLEPPAPRAPKARKAAAKETAPKETAAPPKKAAPKKAAPKKAAPKKAAPKKAAPKKAAPKKAAPKKAAPKKRKPAKGRRGA